MKPIAIIKINAMEYQNAVHVLTREEQVHTWRTNVEFKKRLVGILGEIAAAKYLNGVHGQQRIIIPMGVNARTGIAQDAFGDGDILTLSRGGRRNKTVHVYEVKSTEGRGGRLPALRQDDVDRYVSNGVDYLLLVSVYMEKGKAECRILKQITPATIAEEWRQVTNKHGFECYAI
ncbi:hypothetical protein [Brucella melitensis]|uniref:hypothetical protein n=1 Tax=Brucella melitensis TaxID=29459 RepID=UPI0032C108BD